MHSQCVSMNHVLCVQKGEAEPAMEAFVLRVGGIYLVRMRMLPALSSVRL